MSNFKINLDELMNSTGFDEETSLELIAEFLSYATVLLNEIELYLLVDSFNKIKGSFHQLKGSSGNLRIKEVNKLAEQGEQILLMDDKSGVEEIVKNIKIQLKDILDELNDLN